MRSVVPGWDDGPVSEPRLLSPGVVDDAPDPDGVPRRPQEVLDLLWAHRESGHWGGPQPTAGELAAARDWATEHGEVFPA